MPSSADLVQIAIVPESVYGTTPASPAFLVVRTTGEGLSFAPTTTISNEMNPYRQVTDSILTGGQSTGDINFELAYEDWFELLLAGGLADDWVNGAEMDSLKIGTTLKSFTIEKRIPVPGGTTQYHRFTGCVVNGVTINIQPNQPITGSMNIIGKAVETSEVVLSGATYTDPDLTPVMVAPRVVDILVGGVAAVDKCFSNLTFTLSNNNRVIECIGTLGPRETVLGRAEVSASFSVLFNDSELLNILINQTETSLEFSTVDTSGSGSPNPENKYTWRLPRVKFTADQVVAGGTNQDVVNAITAQALYSTGEATTLEVLRTHRA